ncbi:MAG TPA: cell wall hydrolase [Rhizomicrobium sp.]|nr:cell wall hydrolase [Rhizomicrobium sp.]
MNQKSRDVLARSDRVLIAALAIVLATASAAVGTALTARPPTDEVKIVKVETPVVRVVPTPVIPAKIPGGSTIAARLLAEHQCLAQAIYFETRGNTDDGQKAVVEVIFNRIKSGRYGSSICGVVYQGASTGHCQFSWVCTGAVAGGHREPKEWARAQELAARVLTGEDQLNNLTQGAVGFHATSIQPNWGGQFVKTVEIGGQVFYRRAGHTRSRGI